MISLHSLNDLSKKELEGLENKLNHWIWPEKLGEKPEGWDSMPPYKKPHMDECDTKDKYIRPYMEQIRAALEKS